MLNLLVDQKIMNKRIKEFKSQADKAFTKGNLNEGLSNLVCAAELGCDESRFRLADIYFNESNVEQGFAHLKASSLNGNAHARVFIAFFDWLIHKEHDSLLEMIKLHKQAVPFASLLYSLVSDGAKYKFEAQHEQELSIYPRIRLLKKSVPNLLGKILMVLMGQSLQPSMVYGRGQNLASYNNVRDNFSINFSQVQPFIPLAIIKYYFSKVASLSLGQSEPPMLMRYTAGQKFKPHHDYIDEKTLSMNAYEKQLGQRVRTLLFYLNDDYVAGETYFNNLDIKIKGAEGDVLIFDNVDDQKHPIETSLHEGKAVINGEKWLLSIWYRENSEA